MTESTWKPVESLPVTLVEEYEAGIRQDIQKDALTTGGQTVYTVLTDAEKAIQNHFPNDLSWILQIVHPIQQGMYEQMHTNIILVSLHS